MVSWTHFILLSHFDMDRYVFTAIIILLCFNVRTLFSVLICSISMCVYMLSILYMWIVRLGDAKIETVERHPNYLKSYLSKGGH